MAAHGHGWFQLEISAAKVLDVLDAGGDRVRLLKIRNPHAKDPMEILVEKGVGQNSPRKNMEKKPQIDFWMMQLFVV